MLPISSSSSISSTQNYVEPGTPSQKKDNDPKVCNKIFEKAIKDQSSVNNPSPSIPEHHVTFYTSSERAEGVQGKEPSTEIKNPESEKKKKKKKKKSPEEQRGVVALIGQSAFGLTPMPPPPSAQAVSLYSQTYCPSFNESEKKLLGEILKGDLFFENSNLLKVFIGEFYKDWKKLNEILKSIPKDFFQQVPELPTAVHFFNSNNIFIEIFNLDSSLLKYRSDNELKAFESSNPLFNSPVSITKTFLNKFIKNGVFDLKKSALEIVKFYKDSRKKLPVSVDNLEKYATSYEKKCKLLLRCLIDENIETFCSKSNTNLWIESVKKQNQTNEDKVEKFKQLSCLIEFIFFKTESMNHEIKLKGFIENYINSITDIISGKINIKSLANFMRVYKQYALYNSQRIIGFKSIKDIPGTNNILTNKYRNYRYDLEYIDKWVSDLHEAICFHFYEEFNALGVSSPQAHLERLHTMIHIARTGMDEIIRSKEDNSSSDPFINSIKESIQKLTSEIEDEFHKSNNLRESIQTGDGELLQNLLMEELQKKPFQLTHLFSIMPENMKKKINGGEINTLIKQMNTTLREIVKDAKNNNRLGDWTSKDLKEKIQEILLDETLELCVYLLIMAEFNNLCSEDQLNGFMSFLPNEIVSLLDLTGFEEIFADTPVLQSPCESLITSEDEDNPITQQVEKPSCESSPPVAFEIAKKVEQKKAASAKTSTQATKPAETSRKAELPTKQEFKDAVNERIFLRLMKRLGFTLSTHGKHPGYEKNGYRIPVPCNLQALGTRLSIYEQATTPLRNSERKRD